MKKKILILFVTTALFILLSQMFYVSADSSSDFQIDKNGVLTKYTGIGGDVVIPNGVTSIGYEVFAKCNSVTSIKMPSSLTKIGEEAFWSCTGLKYIVIPANVTIDKYAFDNCSSLTAINVDKNNPYYTSIDGVLFDKGQTKLINYPAGKIGVYTIPNSVTTVGEFAFDGCDGLTSVTIPDSVTNIENMAFSGTGLTDITFPNSLDSTGNYTFLGCESLISITLPSNIKTIGDEVFAYCTALKTMVIPSTVTAIGYNAFSGCSALTSIIIPDSVVSLDSAIFWGCDNVTIYCSQNDYIRAYAKKWNMPVALLIPVTVNGTALTLRQPPIMQDERTLVPLRAIFEALGATINWDDSTETITATKDYTTITLQIGNSNMGVNEKTITLDVPAQIIGNSTMVPIRAVAEALGATVNWNDSTQTVEITQ